MSGSSDATTSAAVPSSTFNVILPDPVPAGFHQPSTPSLPDQVNPDPASSELKSRPCSFQTSQSHSHFHPGQTPTLTAAATRSTSLPKTLKKVNMSFPPKQVLLSSRAHIDRFDAGLTGVIGSQKLVSDLITHRCAVTKLTLSHNSLGDSGVAHIFSFLCSPDGSRHRGSISEISLNGNGIGCEGLLHLAEYIRNNEALRILWIQNNALIPEWETLTIFAKAVNKSRVQTLSFTGNVDLGDAFIERFIPQLEAPYLRELHINTVKLTQRSACILAEWITRRKVGGGRRCMLETFKCNGNNLGLKGVKEIVRAIEKGNWSLTKAEMYANQLAEPEEVDENEQEQEQEVPSSNRLARIEAAWSETERSLRRVLLRNLHLKRQTEKEALGLLKYSRALLQRSKSTSISQEPALHPFQTLPVELQLYILSLLAPSLSAVQRTHVYNYAANPSTLPPLLPSLRREAGKVCLADPTSLGVGVGFEILGGGGRCAEGKCMGIGNSLVCRREEERVKWLQAVGCYVHDPDVEV